MTQQQKRSLERNLRIMEPEKEPDTTWWLGYTIQGVFSISIEREPAKLRVRSSDGRYVKAFNDAGIYVEDDLENAHVAVEMEEPTPGEFHITGLSLNERDAYIQINPNILLKPHMHNPGDIGDDEATAGNILVSNGVVFESVSPSGGGGGGSGDLIVLKDKKASGTDAGAFTAGSWVTRDLNDEEVDTGNNCTLTANQFELDDGTYRVYVRAPAFNCAFHKTRLWNDTDSVVEIVGESSYCSVGRDMQTSSVIVGQIQVTGGPKIYEIQHQCGSTQSPNGLGVASNLGEDEVYTTVVLTKVV